MILVLMLLFYISLSSSDMQGNSTGNRVDNISLVPHPCALSAQWARFIEKTDRGEGPSILYSCFFLFQFPNCFSQSSVSA